MSLIFKLIDNGTAHLIINSNIEFLDQLTIQLEKANFPDLLIEDPHNKLTKDEIEAIINLLENHNRCTILIKPITSKHNFSSEIIIVPTIVEALDYISFEQIQRDLDQ